MKKFIIGVICIILATLVGCQNAKAQTINREGKTFVSETNKSNKANDIETSYYWKSPKGETYKIYLHKYTKGDKKDKWGSYVLRVSQKTGKEYKYFLPEDITAEIIRELQM